ncbi:hypothetical protein [Pleionea litopenaei]|uniref:Uncharacterized protein n=1 Tax=Pleionea litopenaei TaxID=3070815 RepID=A0AA51RSV2_9GAMM|nr:hypothetical protein [Pleionea sp. HL-JVS1]WMS86986.1 hypothetical protein Q9312_17365 [Pleionea sp. HL-JVS1]
MPAINSGGDFCNYFDEVRGVKMQKGDIVQSQADGIKMTVYSMVSELPSEQVCSLVEQGYEENDVLCKWFVGTTLKKDVFHQQQLLKVS